MWRIQWRLWKFSPSPLTVVVQLLIVVMQDIDLVFDEALELPLVRFTFSEMPMQLCNLLLVLLLQVAQALAIFLFFFADLGNCLS